MIKGVLFDLDGTFADTAPDLAAALNHVRELHNLPPLPLETIRPQASHGARGLLGLGFDVAPDDPRFDALRVDFLAYYNTHICVHTALFPGMAELVAELEQLADHRASTPTDAAKAVVPDAAVERRTVEVAWGRVCRALGGRLDAEGRHLASLMSRPVMTDPGGFARAQRASVVALRDRGRRRVAARLEHDAAELRQLSARVHTLSPQATLDRGYAIVSHEAGAIVRDPAELTPEELLAIRVAGGPFAARAVPPEPDPSPPGSRYSGGV